MTWAAGILYTGVGCKGGLQYQKWEMCPKNNCNLAQKSHTFPHANVPKSKRNMLLLITQLLKNLWIPPGLYLHITPVVCDFQICSTHSIIPRNEYCLVLMLTRINAAFFLPNPRYSGNHIRGRGSGGHQRAEQQLLSGYQQEGGTVRRG